MLREEGGLADRPAADDPGGLTMRGVTQGSLDRYRMKFPNDGFPDSVRDLTEPQAEKIYKTFYWDAVRGDDLPPPIALVSFDGAVMSGAFDGHVGARRDDAIEWLQHALGVTVDGKIGPKTLNAAATCDVYVVIGKMIEDRLRYYTQLPNFPKNPGWLGRMARLAVAATRMQANV